MEASQNSQHATRTKPLAGIDDQHTLYELK
jgi:hypothetical protein